MSSVVIRGMTFGCGWRDTDAQPTRDLHFPAQGYCIYSPHRPRLGSPVPEHITYYHPSIKHYSTETKPRPIHYLLAKSSTNSPTNHSQRDISQATTTVFEDIFIVHGIQFRHYYSKTPTCLFSSALPVLFANGSSPLRHMLAMPSPYKTRQQHTWQLPLAPVSSPDLEG